MSGSVLEHVDEHVAYRFDDDEEAGYEHQEFIDELCGLTPYRLYKLHATMQLDDTCMNGEIYAPITHLRVDKSWKLTAYRRYKYKQLRLMRRQRIVNRQLEKWKGESQQPYQ